jgi:hypothetical protein
VHKYLYAEEAEKPRHSGLCRNDEFSSFARGSWVFDSMQKFPVLLSSFVLPDFAFAHPAYGLLPAQSEWEVAVR